MFDYIVSCFVYYLYVLCISQYYVVSLLELCMIPCISFILHVYEYMFQENVNHHAAQSDPTDMPTETIPQQVQSSNTAGTIYSFLSHKFKF